MNMFARWFDENPAMTLQDIKATKRYGRTDVRTDGCTHGQRKNSIPTKSKVFGGGGGGGGGIITTGCRQHMKYAEKKSYFHTFDS